jgi:hypothetical protein
MKMLSVRLDDREAAALREVCERTGLSRSQAVKRAIQELRRAVPPDPGGLARKLGVYGCWEGSRGASTRSPRQAIRAKLAR